MKIRTTHLQSFDRTKDARDMTTADEAAPTTGLIELGAAPLHLHDLHAEHASFAYDGRTVALADINLELREGQALALIGPNGAGKSTFLKGVLGLIPAVSGHIDVLGQSPRQASARIGYMPQSDEIDPEFPVTLRQVVMMGRYRGLGPFRWPGKRDREAVNAALERVGLAEHATAHFGSLSGGQQQRGMLARAIVSEPSLLLLDEPFNGLDRTNREALLELLRELRAGGASIIVSTHDFEIATEACTHVLMLNRCQIGFGPIESTLTSELLDETFDHATADDEAHGHFNQAHGHYHETGFRGVRDHHGTAESHLSRVQDEDDKPDSQGQAGKDRTAQAEGDSRA